ncbi:MAG: restriction endonuclease subunit S [Chitinophagales bacterium]|nr:restriction endonuclease subunit S [Chitinophagales bacterium]
MNVHNFVKALNFLPKENASDIFIKKYADNYAIEVDVKNSIFNFGGKVKVGDKAIQNITKPEDWVVFECVDRLLEKGYKPKNISLEKVYPAGHGFSGRLDICVTHDDGSEYLLIECKTYGKEFDKALNRLNKDGGQLFTYFKFSNKADVIMLYTSELKGKEIVYQNEIIKIEADYRTGDVKDFYEKWNKLTKDNGIFDTWVKPYNFESKALTINDLEEIRQEDSSFIFNRFLEILRHNVVSDKGNAFNRIFTLFLCKIYDEKDKEDTDKELEFQWFESPFTYDGVYYEKDDHKIFQIRLTDLYKNGMKAFLEKNVTDLSDQEFNDKFYYLTEEQRAPILVEFKKIRLEKNNEFAIKDVYDEQSFYDNAVVVKEIVELLQKYKIRYTKKQQYLSDFFELLLTTGLKQESGQFFTPVPVSQFIIKSLPIDKIIEDKLQKGVSNEYLPHVIDYAAGSGHFLTESMHEIQRIIDSNEFLGLKKDVKKFIDKAKTYHFDWAFDYVYGIEKDYRLVKVGKVGCYLHGDGLANVIHSDGLARFSHSDYKGILKHQDKDFPKENKQFDIVISNPPYSVSAFRNNASKYYNQEEFDLYNKLTDVSSEIECLFIERTKQLLKDGGVAGIILPSSILSNSGIYAKAREVILQYFDIVAITELGSNTFMATGTNTVTLFLRRRNNYDCEKIKSFVNRFLDNFLDNTIQINDNTQAIEKPIAKYINHVWQDISFDDYVTLLKQKPTKAIETHEIYKEYRKKIKAKDEKAFWQTLIEIETEKLYYFIMAYPQKVVLVKSGEKNAEKRFLGYEFSNRRGSEGIHPIQRGKNISDCTQLFDEDTFENPSKASTYIYKAFTGDYDFAIDKTMQKNISRHDLVDMLTFDRVDFEKNISLSVKKKVKIESKWELVRIGDLSKEIINGSTPSKNEFKFWDKKELNWLTVADFNSDKLEVDNTENFVSRFALENNKVRLVPKNSVLVSCTATIGKVGINSIELTTNQQINSIICNQNILPYYLGNILKVHGKLLEELTSNSGVKHVNLQMLNDFKIPLPPLNIQQKIVAEIEVLETKEKEAKEKVEEQKENIKNVISKVSGNLISLSEITSKIGSGATPRGGEGSYKQNGISLIRSQNVYDNEFYEKGLAFIDEEQAEKLKGVTVEKNDILFNITGASICRCCIVPEIHLPARVNQHVSIIRVTKKALPKYVQTILVSETYKNQLLEIGDGATSREAITKQQLEDFKIPLPPITEQQKIVAKIEKIEAKIKDLETEIASIPKQKEAILKKHL